MEAKDRVAAARAFIAGEGSVAEYLASLPVDEWERILAGMPTGMFRPDTWAFWSRPKQRLPPGDWHVWLILAGRGFGKTRTGAETVRLMASGGHIEHIAVVGETEADVRNVMVEGPDGILRLSPGHERPLFEPTKRRLTWPNGVMATTYSGVDPEQLRGPQHGFAWVDELAKFARAEETWDNLMMGLRMGAAPRCLVTTTPRPIGLLRDLVRRDGQDVYVTHGTTYENEKNLPEVFLRQIVRKYEGSTIGRQELMAELLDEAPGALWKRSLIDTCRQDYERLVRIVVGVDPSTAADGGGDACGIVVAGIDDRSPLHCFVLEDATVHGGPNAWAQRVASVYRKWAANLVVAEANQGGDLVRAVLRQVEAGMYVRMVHASKGKVARAEPVVALYEQGRVHHPRVFAALEEELVTWVPGRRSPNRLDALVWCLTELMLQGGGEITGEIF